MEFALRDNRMTSPYLTERNRWVFPKLLTECCKKAKTAIYAVRCTQIRREITSEVENNILIVVSSFFSIVHLTPHTEVIECIWITTSYLLTASY